MKNVMWVDKYQPKTLEEYIIEDSIKEQLNRYISNGDIPHLILEGSYGLGKTSLAKLLANLLDSTSLYINASIDTSIDNIRNDVTNFCSRKSSKPLKVVIFDEADRLSPEAQDSLKAFVSKYQTMGCRFIFTTNHFEKIDGGFDSRFITITFSEPSIKDLGTRLCQILTEEEISFKKKDVLKLINECGGDIRKSIERLQSMCIDGVYTYTESETKLVTKQIIEVLTSNDNKESKFKRVKQIIVDNNIKNYEKIYSELFDMLEEWVKEGNYCEMTIILNTYSYQSKPSHDKSLNFMAFISEISL